MAATTRSCLVGHKQTSPRARPTADRAHLRRLFSPAFRTLDWPCRPVSTTVSTSHALCRHSIVGELQTTFQRRQRSFPMHVAARHGKAGSNQTTLATACCRPASIARKLDGDAAAKASTLTLQAWGTIWLISNFDWFCKMISHIFLRTSLQCPARGRVLLGESIVTGSDAMHRSLDPVVSSALRRRVAQSTRHRLGNRFLHARSWHGLCTLMRRELPQLPSKELLALL